MRKQLSKQLSDLSPATEALPATPGFRPGGRLTFLLVQESKQRTQPYRPRPCASLRANLRHAIQTALPPNSLRACSASLKQAAASQFTMQRCPAAALPAARTACRRRKHTGGYGRPARVVTKSTSNAYPKAIAAIKKQRSYLVSPLVPTLPAGAAAGTVAAGAGSLPTFWWSGTPAEESRSAGGPRPAFFKPITQVSYLAHQRSAGQYDLGRPSTFSAIKHMMSCGLTGARRGIQDSRI